MTTIIVPQIDANRAHPIPSHPIHSFCGVADSISHRGRRRYGVKFEGEDRGWEIVEFGWIYMQQWRRGEYVEKAERAVGALRDRGGQGDLRLGIFVEQLWRNSRNSHNPYLSNTYSISSYFHFLPGGCKSKNESTHLNWSKILIIDLIEKKNNINITMWGWLNTDIISNIIIDEL